MLNQDYKEMLSLLLENDVEFLLVGAYAMAAHGFPRATGDMDIFVNPSHENASRVYETLRAFGAPTEDISAEDFAVPGTIFQIGVIPRRIDIITHIDGVSFDEASKEKNVIQIDGLAVPVLSKECLIKNKEATGRAKDKVDADFLKTQ